MEINNQYKGWVLWEPYDDYYYYYMPKRAMARSLCPRCRYGTRMRSRQNKKKGRVLGTWKHRHLKVCGWGPSLLGPKSPRQSAPAIAEDFLWGFVRARYLMNPHTNRLFKEKEKKRKRALHGKASLFSNIRWTCLRWIFFFFNALSSRIYNIQFSARWLANLNRASRLLSHDFWSSC